ncbi:MAG: hypothetical protein IIB19_02445 [Chloroflexi bacterium]|nr:hypothetical protein [Chloroflexota bacterium]
MRTLGILIALVALVVVSLMLIAREATPSHAADQVTVSLDAVQKGKSANACPVVNEAKCTLNAGDTFDVVVSIKGSTAKVIPYQDWTFDVVHNGLTRKISDPAGVVNSSACPPSFGSVPSYTIISASEETVSCDGMADAGSTVLATLNFTCDAGTHSVDVNDLNIAGFNVAGSSIAINCGESASMTLERKDTAKPYVQDKVDVAVVIGDLKLKDEDGDGKTETTEMLVKTDYQMSEHGPHAILPGPDGFLYILFGNRSHPMVADDPKAPLRNQREDFLLPRYLDPRGHANDIRVPGGSGRS